MGYLTQSALAVILGPLYPILLGFCSLLRVVSGLDQGMRRS